MSEPVTKNLTILLTDIKEFTEKTSRKTRSSILEMLEKHKEIVLPILENKGGRLVKTIGDAFLVVFESPTDAVLAGVAVQDALAVHNEGKETDDRIDVRIAINLGEVNIADNDIFGEPVNITARIEGFAEAGEVFFTEAVYLAMNKREVPSSEVGYRQLKGLSEKVKVYKVVREHPVEELPEGPEGAGSEPPRPRKPRPGEREDIPTAAASVAEMSKPSVFRRAGALVIDGIIVAVLAGMLGGGDSTQVHIRNKNKFSGSKIEKKIMEGMGRGGKGIDIGEGGVRLGDDVKFDKDGVRVGDDIVLNDDGLRIGDVLTLDKNGLKIGGSKKRASAKPAADKNQENKEKKTTTRKDALREAARGERDRLKRRLREIENAERGGEGDWEVTRRRKKNNPIYPIFWVLYCTLFLAYWAGATPGKKILKLKVVQVVSGAHITWKHALVRSLFTLVSFTIIGLGFLWALWEDDGRGWHDLIAGTRVVRDPLAR